MPTPEKVNDHIAQAISLQTLYNIKSYGLYKDNDEREEVIFEEITEVIGAFNDYKKYLHEYDFMNDRSNTKMKKLCLHIIEECIHTISAINKTLV